VVSFLASAFTILGLPTTNQNQAGEYSNEFHAHCQVLNAFIANKIGSGFDIACSVYGSQIYKRFTNISQLSETLIPQLTELLTQEGSEVVNFESDQVTSQVNKYFAAFEEFVASFDY